MTLETARDADLAVTDALDAKSQAVVDFVTADALTRQPAVAVGGHLLRSTMSGTFEAKQEALGALEGRFLIRYVRLSTTYQPEISDCRIGVLTSGARSPWLADT